MGNTEIEIEGVEVISSHENSIVFAKVPAKCLTNGS